MKEIVTTSGIFAIIRSELIEAFSELEDEISIFLNHCIIEQAINPSLFQNVVRIRTITGRNDDFPLDAGDIPYRISSNEMENIVKFTKEEFANYALI